MKTTKTIFILVFLVSVTYQTWGQSSLKADYNILNQELQKEFGSKFGFSVLVADQDNLVFEHTYGYLDAQNAVPANDKTLYNIASITKSFTSVGIFLLIEQGKLNLLDSLEKFFDHVPLDKRAITVAQLLSHRSGFQQNYVCDGIKNSSKALHVLMTDSLGFIPGTEFNYSSQNYEMLALIIETITHTTYENFIRKEILLPLKMSHTLFWNEIAGHMNVAAVNPNYGNNALERNWGFIGSGGIYSTSSDLYKFISAVISNRLISKASTELAFTPYYTTKSGIGIGYGWFINETTEWETKEIWTRGNEHWGPNAIIRWFSEKEKIIIVCTNSGEIGGDKQVTGNRIVSKYIADYLWKHN